MLSKPPCWDQSVMEDDWITSSEQINSSCCETYCAYSGFKLRPSHASYCRSDQPDPLQLGVCCDLLRDGEPLPCCQSLPTYGLVCATTWCCNNLDPGPLCLRLHGQITHGVRMFPESCKSPLDSGSIHTFIIIPCCCARAPCR